MNQVAVTKTSGRSTAVVAAIALIGLAYGVSLGLGWPQQGTHAIVAADHSNQDEIAHDADDAGHDPADNSAPPLWTVAPFVLLLAAIATFPLMHFTMHWWESNLNRFKIAGSLAALTLLYYLLLHGNAIEGHWPAHHVADPTSSAVQFNLVRTVLENAILGEYIPFIVLLFSLYTINGGIRITGDLQANPITNALFMAAGGVLASLIGTTGAAMLLIRPLLETNRQRKYVAHTLVFFIFVVCNAGGLLLPLGDPPLFLGYLNGVAFLWTLKLWKSWLLVNGLLLIVYFAWDHFYAYPREAQRDIARDKTLVRPLSFLGLWPNALLLAGVVFAVGLLDPSKPFPGTEWHPGLYLREAVELGLVLLSLWLGSRAVRVANSFNFGAIVEVAALFIGIFICMQPALEILNVRGPRLGLDTPHEFFWASGSLSAVLDNAPTYLVFFKTAWAMSPNPSELTATGGVDEALLMGISLGSVFMGAMTYIGNGPNFMVKAIAESSGVKMPSFFGYLLYSIGVLLPILALNVWLFL